MAPPTLQLCHMCPQQGPSADSTFHFPHARCWWTEWFWVCMLFMCRKEPAERHKKNVKQLVGCDSHVEMTLFEESDMSQALFLPGFMVLCIVLVPNSVAIARIWCCPEQWPECLKGAHVSAQTAQCLDCRYAASQKNLSPCNPTRVAWRI